MYVLDNPLIREVLLSVTAVVLLCGCGGLFLISWKSPLLRGLGWVAGSFALGGTSALLAGAFPVFAQSFLGLSAGLSPLLMLGCFSLLDRSARGMLSEEADLSRFSVLLLVLQAALSLSHVFAKGSGDLQRIGSGVFLGTQACTTALMLVRRREETARIPALLCAFLLFGYAILLGVRGLFALRGTAIDRTVLACAQVGLSMAMLAVLVGVAFGLFWMSTSVFANGLERIASTDPLTRIFNRRTFLLWCDKELQRSLASETPFSLLMLDLDHFKQVNDRFGHGIGDRLLCSVVERVQDGVRGIDVMGRWGGEEFVVLLPRATAEAAFLVAERVRRNIERSSIGLSEGEARGHPRLLRVTSSLGTATYGGPTDTIAAMFERADAALYAAKQRGRNCTVTSGEGRLPQSPTTSVPGIAEATPAPLLDPTAPSAPELVV